MKNLIQYLGWRRFLFRWCITENFSLKALNFLAPIYGFFTIFERINWVVLRIFACHLTSAVFFIMYLGRKTRL